MKQALKKWFTLIELLVVITIIGILATGAVAVYTSQIQKARDTTRVNDIKALQSGIEQVYQDTSEYPHSDTFTTQVRTYVEKFPSDPKYASNCNNAANAATQSCAYAYITWQDNNGIDYGEYEISTAFENSGNVTEKAAKDGGWAAGELNRLEIGIDTANNVTAVAAGAITKKWGACTVAWAAATNGTTLIVIDGNPSTWSGQCN